MYLYKATCPDIPNPKQRSSRCQGGVQAQGRQVKQGSAGPAARPYAPLMLWTANKPNRAVQLKHLEDFLNFHSLSLHDTVRSETGMVYR